jgi:Mg/Co/Ni transporter MgtE
MTTNTKTGRASVSVPEFLATARRWEIVWRALRTSAVVGTLLAAINHGPDLWSGNADARRFFQIGLTYLVPYCVATYAATMQELTHARRGM